MPEQQLFDTPKDFEYFLKHPNTLEIIKLIKENVIIITDKSRVNNDDDEPNFATVSDLGFCRVNFDRERFPNYRVSWSIQDPANIRSEYFDDFIKMVAFIAARWY